MAKGLTAVNPFGFVPYVCSKLALQNSKRQVNKKL
jgi:hypothetical protein